MWKRTETAQAMSIHEKFAEKLCFIHCFKRNTYFWMENYRQMWIMWGKHSVLKAPSKWMAYVFGHLQRCFAEAWVPEDWERSAFLFFFINAFASKSLFRPIFSKASDVRWSRNLPGKWLGEIGHLCLQTFPFPQWSIKVGRRNSTAQRKFEASIRRIPHKRRVCAEAKPSIHSVSKLHSGWMKNFWSRIANGLTMHALNQQKSVKNEAMRKLFLKQKWKKWWKLVRTNTRCLEKQAIIPQNHLSNHKCVIKINIFEIIIASHNNQVKYLFSNNG